MPFLENSSVSVDLLHAVGSLPINPDAFYNNGLGEFFSSVKEKNESVDDTTAPALPKELLTCNQGRKVLSPNVFLVVHF